MNNRLLKVKVPPLPIAYVSAISTRDTAGTNNIVIPKTSGILAGDLLFAIVNAYYAFTPGTAPSGWTLTAQFNTRATTHVYTRTATGSEASSYTFLLSGSINNKLGTMVAFRNVRMSDPFKDIWPRDYAVNSFYISCGKIGYNYPVGNVALQIMCSSSAFANADTLLNCTLISKQSVAAIGWEVGDGGRCNGSAKYSQQTMGNSIQISINCLV